MKFFHSDPVFFLIAWLKDLVSLDKQIYLEPETSTLKWFGCMTPIDDIPSPNHPLKHGCLGYQVCI